MKIFSLPSHATRTRTSGVDYARIISPMKNLNGYKGIETFVYDPKVEELHNNVLEWEPLAKKYDVFYFNYIHNPWGYAVMGMLARKYGVKLILDMDDSLWDLHDDNPAHSVWKKGGAAIGNFTSICNDVDYITCTNEYLKHLIMSKTNKKSHQIKVIPNYIDLKVYKHRTKFKDDGQIMLTHFGSSTHWLDLGEKEFFKGVDRIMREYPNVKFRTIGAWIPKFRQKWGSRFDLKYGDQDLYKWVNEKFPSYMDDTDILLTPLVEDVYNKCKSSIKWLEASSAKIPGVWSDIRQYSEVIDGTNGLLATTGGDWYRGIKSLIDDKEKRRKMGEKAYLDVKNNWEITDHLEEYKALFEEAIDNGKKRV